eukprot:TRINITY_DN6091_c0_g3_i4.p1 TRINITY_DN6091_c0_g3~~TRINITY_DN6091_c0_g3_i4.p1  ORF type:complete len:458 (+),score=32.42 TRINITY_DN6091_c0_g3_i4:36-1376(+)
MIRRPPRSTQSRSSAASDVYKRQGHMYNIRQVRIESEAVSSRPILQVKLNDAVKYYEASSTMEKLAVLSYDNEIVVFVIGKTVNAFEINDPNFSSEEYSNNLIKRYSRKFETGLIFMAVHWISDTLLVATAADGRAFILDPHLTLISLQCSLQFTESIIFSNTPFAVKRLLLNQTADPYLILGSSVCDMLVFELGFTAPWKSLKMSEYLMLRHYLDNSKLEAALKLIKAIENPKHFVRSFVHLCNYLMRRPKLLANDIALKYLEEIYITLNTRHELTPVSDFLKEHFSNLGNRLIASDYYEEAYKIATLTQSAGLMRIIEQYCRWKERLVMTRKIKNELATHDRKLSSDNAIKELEKEDVQQMKNEYHTLMNIESVNELDLSEFSSWGIDFEQYEAGLNLELSGNYEKAAALYEKNKLEADARRAKKLNELSKSNKPLEFIQITKT